MALARSIVPILLLLVTLVFTSELSAGGGRPTKRCAELLKDCHVDSCPLQDEKQTTRYGSHDEVEADIQVNTLKRTRLKSGPVTHLTFDDFRTLQETASGIHDIGEGRWIRVEDRKKLQELLVGAGKKVSEGDYVELRGYIIVDSPRPKPSGPESVNCRLPKAANNDIHIPIVEEADADEFQSVVVEMIPQSRPDQWTSRTLKRIARDERPVIVRGHLFYDNKHKVNDDSDDDNGQPKRFSLWEIHPITEFWVCIRADRKCGHTLSATKDWKRLEDF